MTLNNGVLQVSCIGKVQGSYIDKILNTFFSLTRFTKNKSIIHIKSIFDLYYEHAKSYPTSTM